MTFDEKVKMEKKRAEQEHVELIAEAIKNSSYLETHGDAGYSQIAQNGMAYFAFETNIRKKLRDMIEPVVMR